MQRQYIETINKLKIIPSEHDAASFNITADTMAVIMAYKKEHRLRKGMVYHCLTLDRNAQTDELVDCLLQLKQQNKQIPDGSRFQIVYTDNDPDPTAMILRHWSNIDVKKIDGKFNFFLIDAANNYPCALQTFIAIDKIFDGDANIFYSGISAQSDKFRCAYFAMDLSFRLAKITNLHEVLIAFPPEETHATSINYVNYIQSLRENDSHINQTFTVLGRENVERVLNKVNFTSLLEFPAEFGPLFRNMQSLTYIEILKETEKPYKGNDKILLNEYLNSRIENNPVLNKKQNKSIDKKQKKIFSETTLYLEQNQQSFAAITSSRKNIFGLFKAESKVGVCAQEMNANDLQVNKKM